MDLVCNCELNPSTPKILMLILLSGCRTFPCKSVTRIWCEIITTTRLIRLSILITCLLTNVLILSEEVTCRSLFGVKGLMATTYCLG